MKITHLFIFLFILIIINIYKINRLNIQENMTSAVDITSTPIINLSNISKILKNNISKFLLNIPYEETKRRTNEKTIDLENKSNDKFYPIAINFDYKKLTESPYFKVRIWRDTHYKNSGTHESRKFSGAFSVIITGSYNTDAISYDGSIDSSLVENIGLKTLLINFNSHTFKSKKNGNTWIGKINLISGIPILVIWLLGDTSYYIDSNKDFDFDTNIKNIENLNFNELDSNTIVNYYKNNIYKLSKNILL